MTKESTQPRGSQPEIGRLLARRNQKWCKFNTSYEISYLHIFFVRYLRFQWLRWVQLYFMYNCYVSDPAEIIHKRFNEECNYDEYYVHYDGCDRRLDQWLPPEE